MAYKQTERGSTLVEVLIAITVVTLVLVTSISGLTLVTRNRRYSTQEALSTKYNQESLEWFRKQRDSMGWSSFYNAVKATVIPSGSPTRVVYCLQNTFTTSVVLSNICSGGGVQCATSPTICPQAFTMQSDTVKRYIDIDLINLTNADQIQATAVIEWIDGGKTHTSQAVLKLRKWQ